MNGNETGKETVDRAFAVEEVRKLAYQFADMYFVYVDELRQRLGDDEAKKLATGVLFRRAKERALVMREDADRLGLERVPDNIPKVSRVSYLGWVPSLGSDHCPYGAAWKKRIRDNEWFREYAALYCDVTDTTIAEVFTGKYSHRLIRNVVLGHEVCERIYFESEKTARGEYTYGE